MSSLLSRWHVESKWTILSYLLPVVILAASIINIALHIWPDVAAVSFGFDGWRTVVPGEAANRTWVSLIPLVSILLLASIGWYHLSERGQGSALKPLANSPIASTVTLAILWLIAAFMFWSFRTSVTLGDGAYIAQRMENEHYFSTRWYLAYLIILGVHRTLGTLLSLTPLESLRLTSVLAGATSVVLLAKIVGRLFPQHREQWLLVWLLPSAYGLIQLWFGYAEIYPLVAFGWIVLIWVYLLVLDNKLSLVWASMTSGIVYLFYIGNVLILPAYGYLILLSVSRLPNWQTRLKNLVLNFLVLIGTIMLCLSLKFGTNFVRYWASQVASANTVMGASSDSIFYPAAMLLGKNHIMNIINEWLLVDASGILLTILGLLLWKLSTSQRRSQERNSRMYLLGLVAIPYLVYSFMMEPLLGYPMDWDLFSYVALFTWLFGGYVFIQSREQLPAFKWLYVILATSGWLHLWLTLPPLLKQGR